MSPSSIATRDANKGGVSARGRDRFLDHPLVVFLLSAGATLAFLKNHILPLNGILEDGNGDYGLMVWNLWFVNEALTHLQNPFWTNWIYFPVGTWLSKHTLVAGFFPLTFLVQNISLRSPLYPLFAYKTAIWASFSLTLTFSYLLFRELGFSRGISLFPSLTFAFCRFSQLHSPHINHLAGAAILPATALLTARLLRDPRPFRACLLAAFLAYGVYLSEVVVYVEIALLLALLTAFSRPSDRGALRDVMRSVGSRGLLVSAFVFTVIAAPFLGAWIRDVANPPKEAQGAVTSANLAGFVVPDPNFNPLYGATFASWNARVRRGVSGRETFLGFPLVILSLVGLFAPGGRLKTIGAVIFVAFLVLSLGPELKILEDNTEVPLPYSFLRRVPPFEMARSPVRFVLVAFFGAALLSAEGLSLLEQKIRRRLGAIAATGTVFVFVLWTLAETHLGVPPVAPFEIPKPLSDLVPGAVLNVPISAWDGYAVFLQTFHHHPIATGFVSRGEKEPTDHVKDLDRLLETDTAAFASRLKTLGITNVVVGPRTPPRTINRVRELPLNLVWMRQP